MSNAAIAKKLLDHAELLALQGETGFRERAYRRAAQTIDSLIQPARDLLASKGIDGLIALPGVGKGIAGAIAELVLTGHWAQHDRLRGDLSAEALFQTIPGIGPELSRRLVEDAHLETLEDLEHALHQPDKSIKGMGPRRREAITAVLNERLKRQPSPRPIATPWQPPVQLLLKVDAMYRERAAAGNLRLIAPKRFNPSGRAWLPVMHASHDEWHFTALFSNTARAHQLARTRDWVVIYYQTNDHVEGRCTVVSEQRGPQAGKRVVRGREAECAALAVETVELPH